MVVPLVPQFAIHYVISKREQKITPHCAKNILKVVCKVFPPNRKLQLIHFSMLMLCCQKNVVASCAADELYPFSWVSIILTLKGIKFMMCSSSVHCRKFFVGKLKLFRSLLLCGSHEKRAKNADQWLEHIMTYLMFYCGRFKQLVQSISTLNLHPPSYSWNIHSINKMNSQYK